MACKSSTAFYADTGTGKTGLAGSWARWVRKSTGLPVRYYTAEPGGIDTIGDLVDDGTVEVVAINENPNFSEALEFASEGYGFDGPRATAPDHSKYGGYIHEGGTSYGEHIMEELRIKAAKNEIVGAEKAPQQYSSGALRIAGSNQTHYGIAQGRIRRAIQWSQRLPVHILWTFRECKASDEEMVSGFREIYGPQIVGSAMTPHIPSWFGATYHLDIVREGKELKPIRRVFTKPHFYEGSKTPYMANPRLPIQVADEFPESFVIKSDGTTMIEILELRQALRDKLKKNG